MSLDVSSLTLVEAGRQLAAGETTSVALTEALLARIDQVDGELNAYVSLNRDMALGMAKAADARRASGETGPLLGLPIAIKDLLNVEGQPCTCSSRILEGYTAPYDATAIAKLRAAGAVFVGRTNMDEFAMGSSTENSAMGVTRNPHDHDRVPGGSSGGSAAAVGGGEALAALGTDTGGSIRQPAAFCGCVGLKPTYGRISRYGLTAFASSLDQIGPMTRTVADAALLLQAMAGGDPMDSTCVDVPVPDYTAALKPSLAGMRLGLPKEYFVDGIEPEVRARVMAAVESCRALGAEIVDVSLPHTEYAIPVYYIIATAEASANLARFDGVRYGRRAEGATDPIDMYGKTRDEGFGDEVKRRIILGTYVLSGGYHDAYYVKAQKVRTLIRQDFEEAFKVCDALLAPVTPTTAFKVGENAADPIKMYLNDVFTATTNLAGICAMSVPCGKTSGGLPVGLQILGPAFGEECVLHVGHAYECAATTI
jgi:aspartyl-tRNA(Asn)/glutamyl-tRNA(Gln) amidotransferase subunit A